VTQINHGFDDVARSLTRRLIAAAEQGPTRAFEPRPARPARTIAVLLATAAVVAGVIGFGTGVLRIQTSHAPTSAPPPPLVSPSVSPSPLQTPETSPTPSPADSIGNVRMFSSSDGWAQRQSDGAILHTTQGVQRWTVASPTIGSQEIIAAAFVDANAARVLTAASLALETNSTTVESWATDDGGVTWTRGGALTGFIDSPASDGQLDFVDREQGWFSFLGPGAAASGAIAVYRTIDGGLLWQEVDESPVSPPAPDGKLPGSCDENPVAFLNASTGWDTAQCAGGPAYFYMTRNGGVNWKPQSLGLPWQGDGYQTTPPQFVDSHDGFMLGSVGLPGTLASLFVTTNGGDTWVRRSTSTASVQSSFFVNAEDGWVTDNSSDLYATRDAGRSWTNLQVATVGGLDFLTPTLGWSFVTAPIPSSGPAGLMQTTDGGHTWTQLTPTISG
jgi:photosystem II stability/assembly factor-like uncharacterized protein